MFMSLLLLLAYPPFTANNCRCIMRFLNRAGNNPIREPPMPHDRVVAILSSNNEQRKPPNKDFIWRDIVFLLGWFLGAIGSDLLLGQECDLNPYSIAVKLLSGVLGLAVMHKDFLPALRPHPGERIYPWWIIFLLGVATGLVGRFVAAKITA